MSLEYIRTAYGVPAELGRHIQYTDLAGVKWQGVITGAVNAKLKVELDGFNERRSILHPTWNVEYL
jgi:hypothetical protein